ncbi:DgyrCDS14078 [Dimorphilus gyrociliatus]|uniref:DgyrCDS14078 n=1 Tax=Dimorphilus gyrociliatus TaxID=2664684 RepID=A0A7I8WCH7_9ANNE|nr:DgyrCDS14078 [Dimorphilus gyrociliatus]
MENTQKKTMEESRSGLRQDSDCSRKSIDRTFDDLWTGWLWPEDEVEPPNKLRRVSRSFTSLRMVDNIEGDKESTVTKMQNDPIFVTPTKPVTKRSTKRKRLFNKENLPPLFSESQQSPVRIPAVNVPDICREMSARQKVVVEMLQKERNYAKVLAFMIKVKNELECSNQPGGAILTQHDIRDIFGSLQEIYDTHCQILKQLNYHVNNWQDSCLIGNIIQKNIARLEKVYPPYVKYQDRIARRIAECDSENERFKEYEKKLKFRLDGTRESLAELVIRPVQKLPSMELLLENLLSKTNRSHADYKQLQNALRQLRQVTCKLNEGKRMADEQIKLFELNERIDGLPPTLLSSSRHFLCQANAFGLTEESASMQAVTLFLFDDSLVIGKKKRHMPKSPAALPSTPQRRTTHKFLKEIRLNSVKRVVDVKRDEIKGAFAIVCSEDENERVYAFATAEDQCPIKRDLLTALSKQENVVPSDLFESSSYPMSSNKSLSRAARCLSRRVSRAFSFSRTPKSLQKAMASVTQAISPRTPLSSKLTSMANRRFGLASSMLDLTGACSIPEEKRS